VHNLKTKSSGIILTLWAMFVPISAFLLFLISRVACVEEDAYFWRFDLFLPFLPNKKTFPEI